MRKHPSLPLAGCVMGALLLLSCGGGDHGIDRYRTIQEKLLKAGLSENGAFAYLTTLTREAGHRLSGSEGSLRAIEVTRKMLEDLGCDGVGIESVMVPTWVRGPVEEAAVVAPGKMQPLSICALGGSIATPQAGIVAEVCEVHSFEELRGMGDRASGKIIFFNRPMDPAVLETFEGYGGAVDQRASGAVEAARAGGVAALVRSITSAQDDVPHTGSMQYRNGVPRVPVAALSARGANLLSALLRREGHATVRMRLSCETLPDSPSGNVLGQITGCERPEEVILVGGHLDSWDVGTGAHDDGSGCAQAIEVLRLLKKLELKPRRTIRAVLFMNEENGSRGGTAYAENPSRAREKHVAALESDRGGFAPRAFTVEGDPTHAKRLSRWLPLFEEMGICRVMPGGSGVDVSPTVAKGVAGIGLVVESHRYFDYHHSANDTIDKVNPRELELGAIAEALLCYLISEEGL
jgi:carboxypeptidase Q